MTGSHAMISATDDLDLRHSMSRISAGRDFTTFLDRMFYHHNAMLAFCAGLESLADSLPDDIDRLHCKQCADTIAPLLQSAFAFEEDVLFPQLCTHLQGDHSTRMRIDRLMDEHREDEMFADEIAEVLGDWGANGNRWGSNMTGYMLRGFFIGMRRHMSSEQAFVASVLRQSA